MDKNYKSLELDKILNMLAEYTSFADARELALNIEPSHGLFEVNELIKETSDAHSLSGSFGSPSFGNIQNMSNSLRRAEAGAVLTTLELLGIAELLRVIRSVREWRSRSSSAQTSLDTRFNALSANKFLEAKITAAIIAEDEISDNASPALSSIRKKIAVASSRIREKLDKFLHSASNQKYLQDNIVTIRNGRFVIPVKAEFRTAVSGLVHDTSSSGATVFIEPMFIVEANNDIRLLKSKEQAEIERILAELSAEAGACADSISNSYRILTELNVIFAKANLAYSMKASVPIMNDSGRILLKRAVHPLIDRDKAVPVNIELGVSFDTLIVTGPNTGGKTVSLKTIGLFTLMAMCGLMIPAADNSELSVFNNILSDIGDEQSIEQSLSTFSSHMVNIISILEKADDKSLVLIDELGAGTDPVEGAALATAILERLRSKNAKIAATTHYAELKSFAVNTPGAENACCEFDIEQLRPTYKLLIGMPGRSNAFAISERLGIEGAVVERARELVSRESSSLEAVVQRLGDKQNELENQIRENAQIKAQAELLLSEAEKKLQLAEEESKKQLELAKVRAEQIISKASNRVYGILDELEEIRKKQKITAEERSRLKSEIRKAEDEANPVLKRSNEEYKLPRRLKKGDTILIFDIDKKASVLEVNDDSVLVQAGIIKTRVPLSNVRLLQQEKVKIQQQSVVRTIRSDVKRSASTEVDLRGETVLDAITDVDKAIDLAIMQGLHQITIIHGKGSGVLRREIQSHLKAHPSIRSFRLGTYGEGDSGVTIAELK